MSEPSEGKKGLASGWWIAIVVAVITVGGGITQAIISSRRSAPETKLDYVKPPITFVGRVSDDANTPIAGALVLATVDQTVGQGIRTDSNGQFQIELPAETKALSLFVSDDGFASETVQANIRRTGAEPIYLHRLPAQWPVIGGTSQRPPKRKAQEANAPVPPAQKQTPLPQPNQGIENNNSPNNGIQNVCAAGVIGCDQSIHIHDQPQLPNAIFYPQSPIQPEDKSKPPTPRFPGSYEGPLKSYPGVSVSVGVDRIFDNPSFEFVCDVPCEVTQAWYAFQGGGMIRSSPIRPIGQGVTRDMMHHRIYFDQKLSPGGYHISMEVRSRSSAPVKVLSLETISPESLGSLPPQ